MRKYSEVVSGSIENAIIDKIWSTLGIDPKTTPNHLTLGELGMESLFVVELQQGLEREYGLKLTLNEVKNITVMQMKDHQSGRKEILKDFYRELKISKKILSETKFKIPTETYSRLNSGQTGSPLYFLPPVEGIFSLLENLSKKIDRPLIGLNWTQDMKHLNNMEDIVEYYIKLIQKLSPDGNYDIIGISFGAMLLNKLLIKAPINRAVIIDVMSHLDFDEEINEEEYILGTFDELIKSFQFPGTIRERILRELSGIESINKKIKRLSHELKEFNDKNSVHEDLEEILKNTYERAKVIYNYRLNSSKNFKESEENSGKQFLQKNSKLYITKLKEDSNESNLIEKIRETYFLPVKV